jgi:hypothetical protein
MNDWQQSFARKLEGVRSAARDQFESLADEHVRPVFDEMEAFTQSQGLHPDALVNQPGSRSFRFAATEGTYVLCHFRSFGLDECEAVAEFCVPGGDKPAALRQRVRMADLDDRWARSVFQHALDRFADALLRAVSERAELNLELAEA